MRWTLTAAERRFVRAYAARRAGLAPGALLLEIVSRRARGADAGPSDNALALGGIGGTDPEAFTAWSRWRGCATVRGCAAVDIMIRHRDPFGGCPDLVGQIEIVAGVLDGRTCLSYCAEVGLNVALFHDDRRHDWDHLPSPGDVWGRNP
ncbi:hypothetical protein [Poseidonocella sp. HB161398]|uniref:hypothetical protein n=1 Tax=Poseidonocella sp. HB161398 TaxID=2320855 RepID=UPI001109F00F|nr:hypothetical protein [Poseidonocella sp. HB161398]